MKVENFLCSRQKIFNKPQSCSNGGIATGKEAPGDTPEKLNVIQIIFLLFSFTKDTNREENGIAVTKKLF
jgi:hypothetical protein